MTRIYLDVPYAGTASFTGTPGDDAPPPGDASHGSAACAIDLDKGDLCGRATPIRIRLGYAHACAFASSRLEACRRLNDEARRAAFLAAEVITMAVVLGFRQVLAEERQNRTNLLWRHGREKLIGVLH